MWTTSRLWASLLKTVADRASAVRPNAFVGMAGMVQVLLPYLTPALLGPEVTSMLLACSQELPPIRQGGFECRLSGQASQVDVQQCIQRHNGQPDLLMAHVDSLGHDRPPWLRLRALARVWASQASQLATGVEEVWIELDNDGRQREPGVFVGLQAQMGGDEAYAVAEHALAYQLEPATLKPLQPALRRCFRTCPSGAWISHVGVMLGRRLRQAGPEPIPRAS